MRYIFDTNILVKANRKDFPFSTALGFWSWLVTLGEKGLIVVPEAVYEEIGAGTDELPQWLHDHKELFFCPKSEAVYSLPHILPAYGDPVPENLLERLKADPYVVAHAYANRDTVISEEAPNAATSPYNKKIPTICATLGITCWSFPRFLWEMK